MSWWAFILFGTWGSFAGAWAFILYQQLLAKRQGLILEPLPTTDNPPPDSAAAWPSVCVVIAACNEAEHIGACVAAVLADGYPNLRVRVIDDRSSDHTADLVEQIAARDTRVSLHRIRTLPDGWMGKTHALWQGTRDLETDWLLFLDADCRLEPAAIATIIHQAHRRQIDLLSLWPRHDARSFWEHMLIPLCGGIIALWFGSSRVNHPDSPRAFANGQLLLIRRSAYERIDGHRCVKDALIEDVPLAEHAKSKGLRCWVGGGQALFSVRMYTHLRGIFNGWARIYVGALRSGTRILASIAWLLFGSLWPYLVTLALLADHFWPTEPPLIPNAWVRQATAMTVAHLALLLTVSYRFWGMGGCRRRYLWLYPVSVVLVMLILIRAGWWLKVIRSVAWRTTRYPITRNGRIRAGCGSTGRCQGTL